MSSQAQPLSEPRPLVGVAWMLVTGLNFVAVTAIVKHVGGRIPAAELAFLRYALGLVFLIPILGKLFRVRFDRNVLTLFAARGMIHTLGVILWFFAMTNITLAEVTAINYLNPLFVTVGAVFVLGETLHKGRIIAIMVALAGAFVILRPGFRELLPGHFAMLGAAVFFAGSYLITGRLMGLQPARGGAVVAGLGGLLAHLVLADAGDVEVRRLQLGIGDDHHRQVVSGFDLDQWPALLVLQVVGDFLRRLHQHLAGVVLHGLFLDQAQDRQRQ